MRKLAGICTVLFLLCSVTWAQWPKIYNSETQEWTSWEKLSVEIKQSQMIYVGELHNHNWGHKVELLILEKVFAQKENVAIALEMFERDTQFILDGYLTGQVTEEFFLQNSRPWGNYATDYRPLIEFSKAYRLPVLGMNVPRRYASFVAKGKDKILWQMPATEQSFLAKEILAPQDKYHTKFYETMKGHVPPAVIELYYRSQCLKDDTMARSMVEFFHKNPQATIISYTGAFHSDEHLGLVSKVKEQLPQTPHLLLTIIPVEQGKKISPQKYAHLADYVLFAPGNTTKERGDLESLLQK